MTTEDILAKVLKEIRNYSDTLLKELALKQDTSIIKLKKEISIKLISLNFKTYVRHIFKKFYDSTLAIRVCTFFHAFSRFDKFS